MDRQSKTLTIGTYNVHRCIGRDRRYDPERILSVLRDLDSDVLALQELQWRPADALHLLNDFAERLGHSAIAGPTLIDHTGHYGNAILSRLPSQNIRRIDISVPGREPRGAIDVKFQVGEETLRVIGTHLGLQPSERRDQIQHLLACIDGQQTTATVLMGDLNEWFLWGRPLRWLRAFFVAAPAPATFPSSFPVFSLDRIWVSPRHRLRRLKVYQKSPGREASDHLPLCATIELGEME